MAKCPSRKEPPMDPPLLRPKFSRFERARFRGPVSLINRSDWDLIWSPAAQEHFRGFSEGSSKRFGLVKTRVC